MSTAHWLIIRENSGLHVYGSFMLQTMLSYLLFEQDLGISCVEYYRN